MAKLREEKRSHRRALTIARDEEKEEFAPSKHSYPRNKPYDLFASQRGRAYHREALPLTGRPGLSQICRASHRETEPLTESLGL